MDPRDQMEPAEIDPLAAPSANNCWPVWTSARAAATDFSEPIDVDDPEKAWPEAARLRELAVALQAILAQQGERNALCDEFLDLCTMHGESHPGERKLARMFLERIERGEVGAPTEEKPW